MPRAALRVALPLLLLAVLPDTAATDPHLDQDLVPGSCSACHQGHGASRSPMLPGPQVEVCLNCHGSQARRERALPGRRPSVEFEPKLLESTLARSFTHPLTDTAFSRHERDVVTCTSCHSPHRAGASFEAGSPPPGSPKASPRNPARTEFELCTGCHNEKISRRGRGPRRGQRFESSNRSYHPLQDPSRGSSPSVLPELVGRQINCTDCHASSNPADPAGPHGSDVRFILRDEYSTSDGSTESDSAYALCYRCHDREKVLDSPDFPEHRSHVVDHRASCATCHDPHGSAENRGLIRFDPFDVSTAASASGIAGRFAFESTGPGSGACYVTCHGYDHAPATYGGMAPLPPIDEGPGTATGLPGYPPQPTRPAQDPRRPPRRD